MTLILVVFLLYVAACGLILSRIIVGPTFADRAIAADVLTNLVTLFLVGYSVTIRSPIYLDVAVIFAMMSFVGMIAIAKYGVRGV